MSRQFVRSIKNISHTPTEIKVRNLTSNDPSGPSGSDLNELSKLTFQRDKLSEIIGILNKRLSSSKKNSPLHILKSLTIIQYCLQMGSVEFVDYYKVHHEIFTTLMDYDILNKKSKDVINVRKRAKYILKLIQNDKLLREKRENFHNFRSEMLIPGIKSTDADKKEHIRYSLDHRPNDLVEMEMDSSSVSRSLSLDIKRLNYYKNNKRNISLEEKPLNELQLISEESNNDSDHHKVSTNPFRNSIFTENLQSSSQNSSITSFNVQDRRNNNPFIQ